MHSFVSLNVCLFSVNTYLNENIMSIKFISSLSTISKKSFMLNKSLPLVKPNVRNYLNNWDILFNNNFKNDKYLWRSFEILLPVSWTYIGSPIVTEQFWLAATCVENNLSYHFPPVHHLYPNVPTFPATPSSTPPSPIRKGNFDGVLRCPYFVEDRLEPVGTWVTLAFFIT